MSIEVVAAPVVEPISLDEAKDHLNLTDFDEDDGLIQRYIISARKVAEGILDRALITQTLRQFADGFPDGNVLTLIRGPLQEVTSVKTYATDDTPTTMPAADYQVVTTDPPAVVLRSGSAWPSTSLRHRNGVEVEYVAGYGDSSADVPADIKAWLLMKIGDLYENREAAISTGAVAGRVDFVDQLLANEKAWSV